MARTSRIPVLSAASTVSVCGPVLQPLVRTDPPASVAVGHEPSARVIVDELKIAWPTKVLKGDTAPGFTIDLAHKDLSLIVEAANAGRVPVPMGAAAREAFSAARASGFGGQDFSAMVDALCQLAGLAKPRLKS